MEKDFAMIKTSVESQIPSKAHLSSGAAMQLAKAPSASVLQSALSPCPESAAKAALAAVEAPCSVGGAVQLVEAASCPSKADDSEYRHVRLRAVRLLEPEKPEARATSSRQASPAPHGSLADGEVPGASLQQASAVPLKIVQGLPVASSRQTSPAPCSSGGSFQVVRGPPSVQNSWPSYSPNSHRGLSPQAGRTTSSTVVVSPSRQSIGSMDVKCTGSVETGVRSPQLTSRTPALSHCISTPTSIRRSLPANAGQQWSTILPPRPAPTHLPSWVSPRRTLSPPRIPLNQESR